LVYVYVQMVRERGGELKTAFQEHYFYAQINLAQ